MNMKSYFPLVPLMLIGNCKISLEVAKPWIDKGDVVLQPFENPGSPMLPRVF